VVLGSAKKLETSSGRPLDALQGQVISLNHEQHRHQEWLKFQRANDDMVPPDRQPNDPYEDPKLFIWTARAGDILEKVKRARKALHNRQSV
jgi:hypothetical protein